MWIESPGFYKRVSASPLKAEFGEVFAGRRVLVTGATGFIGWNLANELRGLGADVTALSRTASTSSVPEGCSPLAMDLSEPQGLSATLADLRPEIVFHLASLVDGRQQADLVMPMLRANLLGSVHLAQACLDAGVPHLVVAGSSEEPDNERDPAPLSPYAAAKAAATLYFRMFHRAYGLPMLVLRPTLTYGPRQGSTKLIPQALSMLQQGQAPKLATGDRVCDFVFITDVVRGLCHAGTVKDQFGETFDLGTGVGTTVREAIELLARITGTSLAADFAPAGDRVSKDGRIANLEHTRKALGWEPRWSLREGLTATIDSFRQGVAMLS